IMLVGPGGQERTEQEYVALLAKAKLRVTRIVPTESAVSVVVEARVDLTGCQKSFPIGGARPAGRAGCAATQPHQSEMTFGNSRSRTRRLRRYRFALTFPQHSQPVCQSAKERLTRAVWPLNFDGVDACRRAEAKVDSRIVACHVTRRGLRQRPPAPPACQHGHLGANRVAVAVRGVKQTQFQPMAAIRSNISQHAHGPARAAQ